MHAARRRALGLLGALAGAAAVPALRAAEAPPRVPVLAYHRVGPSAADAMTVSLPTFDAQLRVLARLGCRLLPLAEVVAWQQGRRAALPPRAVALTADDGHASQFAHLAPALHERGWPLTLFIYPSAISNAAYAMTWDQLRRLQEDGASVQSHTLWHPLLTRERRQMAPAAFERHALDQLAGSRARLERALGRAVSLLAWPFGETDDGLAALAARTGYEAAFVLGNRALRRDDSAYALPRHLVTEAMTAARLARLLEAAFAGAAG